ncbi:MAG TPA: HD domain-containing protein [Candidatus Koribacter sp.]|jgi:(p)ppGpp synthase/HD superfamily hydrolase
MPHVAANSGFSAKFDEAMLLAHELHRRDVRKGTGKPYISHLLGVCSLVVDYGGDEEMAIAALLHDAAEDHGGLPMLEQIRQRFGDRVAHIVDGCTDSYVLDASQKEPWRQRKEMYLARLPLEDADVRLVSAADKLYNCRTILRDLRRDGMPALDRFNGGRKDTVWYYDELVRVFRRAGSNDLVEELAISVDEMKRVTGYNQAPELPRMPSQEPS